MGYNNKYQYDKGGRVVKSKDKNGNITTYSYKENTDYLENQTAGNIVTSYTYDDWGNMLSATQNTNTNEYTYEYTYKFNNLLESVTTPDNKTISYTYDNNHNVSQVTDYTGDIINYTYNGLNKVDTISRNNTLVADYDYYNFCALQKITYPNQGSSEFTYDNALRLTSQTNKLADNTVTNAYTYTYDKNGNQLTKTDNGSTTSYVYDGMGQLTRVTDPDGTITQYGFDVQGNIEVKIVTHPESISKIYPEYDGDYTVNNIYEEEIWYSHDNNNRLIKETAYLFIEGEEEPVEMAIDYSYDKNGNLLYKDYLSLEIPGDCVYTKYFEYNELNQLTEYEDGYVEISTYTYAPDGMRVSKINNGETTNFYWDRGYMSAESVNNTFTAKNYIGAQGVFARESGNNTEYMLKNGHGDVTNILKNGEVTNHLDYDPYGNQTMGNTTNPYRYCGEYFDEESGLIYLRNRYYNPEIGRFITEDPIQDGLNWYAYCGSNPINFVDPLGYWAEDGSDERFKESNPIVYQAIADLSETWLNLDELEKQGIDIGNMKEDVNQLANKIREIGDTVYVKSTSVLGYELSDAEAVIFYSDKTSGVGVIAAAANASFPGMINTEYKADGTIDNAIKHAYWNALSTILTKGDYSYVELFTDAHEYGYPIVTSNVEYLEHTKMDLFNNSVGRYQGYLILSKTKDKDLAMKLAIAAVLERATSGGLVTINE